MTETEMRIAIAEACGTAREYHIPDYLNDLNAMHEAEKILRTRNDWSACKYERLLQEMTTSWSWHATARQRAEAFLKTIGKWKD